MSKLKSPYFNTDIATTVLGVAIALTTALSTQGILASAEAGLIGGILIAVQGYLINKR